MGVIVLQKDREWKLGQSGSEEQSSEESAWVAGEMSLGPRVYVYVRQASISSTGTITFSFKSAAVKEGAGRFATMGVANDLAFSSADTFPLTKQVGLSNYGAWVLWSAATNSGWGANDYVRGDIHIVTFDRAGNEVRSRLSFPPMNKG